MSLKELNGYRCAYVCNRMHFKVFLKVTRVPFLKHMQDGVDRKPPNSLVKLISLQIGSVNHVPKPTLYLALILRPEKDGHILFSRS